MAEIKAITLPNGDSYDIVDQGARNLISELPNPMVFKGTLGTNGTITSLPSASASNEGFTYKVITDGTYASQTAKVGDVFISNGKEWTLVPSGDEPSGTVTNVATGTGLTGGPITTSGTIAVDFTSVQAKLPTGQNDTYLHLNETTGAIEWSEVQTPDNIVLASSTTISPREIGDTFSGHGFNEFALKDDLPHIVNSLTSTSTADALAANQGKVLDETIATVQNRLQTQIDAITSQSDVVDVVGTKAELNSYSKLIYAEDIVKVLADESYDNAITYYRAGANSPTYNWTYIGSQGPFYTKSETDNLLSGKQTSITASGMLKGDGAGSVSAATAGVDYAAASHSHSASSISAGTFTGAVVAQNNTNYTTKQVRNIFLSTGSPSGGASGDIWIKYTN